MTSLTGEKRGISGAERQAWESLRQEAFRLTFDVSPVRMLLCDRDLVIRGANEAFCDADGLRESDLLGRRLDEMPGRPAFSTRLALLRRALGGEVTTFADRNLRNPRRDHMLRVTYRPVRTGAGDISGVVIVLEDPTRLHDLEQRISMQEEVFRQTADGLAVIGLDCRYLWANPAYTEKWDLTPEQVIGRSVAEIVGTSSYLETVLIPLSRCFSGERFEFEDPHRNDDGSSTVYAIRLEPFLDERGRICGAIVNRRDVTEAAAIRERLSRRDLEDSLTGLPNRHGLEAHLARLIMPGDETAGPSGVLLVVDIDDLQIINDMAGHAAGDGLLKHLAVLLQGLAPGACVARIGSDRFAVLITDTGGHPVASVAENVVSTVEATGFDWQGGRYAIGVSVGAVDLSRELAGGREPTVFELLARGERACLVAREAGGSRFSVFHAEDREIIARHREVMNVRLIHDALRDSRLELHAMPIVPLDGAGTPYEEILLRVLDEEGTPLPPAGFIAAAERHGLMTRVDRWVVEAVLARVPSMPPGYHISVNLSGQSVGDPRFRDFLVAALDAAAPLPGALSFEITETSAVRSFSAARELISALRARGCGVILDDFGSGLSSFGYLRQFDVDMLKIDGSLIGGLLEDRVQQVIVAGIVAVAKAMSVRVVAEYVEDKATSELLRGLGVGFVQGYGIGRPRPWRLPGSRIGTAEKTEKIEKTGKAGKAGKTGKTGGQGAQTDAGEHADDVK